MTKNSKPAEALDPTSAAIITLQAMLEARKVWASELEEHVELQQQLARDSYREHGGTSNLFILYSEAAVLASNRLLACQQEIEALNLAIRAMGY